MPPTSLPGIFCLEGAWGKRIDDRVSVLPTLDMLERLSIATYVHRDVGTLDELCHYLKKWVQAGYSRYGLLYFAFHGVRGGIIVGGKTITLEELADTLGTKAKGRIVYFGSCSVMRDRKGVEEFRRRTGASLVCGYTKNVDWVESASFDLLLLDSLVSVRQMRARINHLRREYGELVSRLGFQSSPSHDPSVRA